MRKNSYESRTSSSSSKFNGDVEYLNVGVLEFCVVSSKFKLKNQHTLKTMELVLVMEERQD